MLRTQLWWSVLSMAIGLGLAEGSRADVIVSGYADSSILRFSDTGSPLPNIVAPGGASGVLGPSGLAFGSDGFLYVSNQASILTGGALGDSVVKVNVATGAVTPFIDLGANYVPGGLEFGPNGNLYITRNGGIAAAAGTGTVDVFNGQTGAFIQSIITDLTQPTGLAFDAQGNLFISNSNGQTGNGSIVKYDGMSATTLVDPAASGGLISPSGLTIGPDGNLYVADLIGSTVKKYNPTTGEFLGDFIPGDPTSPLFFQFPSDVLFDRQGNLLVANLGLSFTSPTGNVLAFDAGTGAFKSVFAADIFGASQLVLTPAATAVPEPTSLALGAAGLVSFGLAALRGRRRP